MPRDPRGRTGKAPRRTRTEPSGAPSSEVVEVRTDDGWSLRADVDEPAGEPAGVAVLAHAMMARRSEFDRPEGAGVRRRLVARGWRVVSFDFRGHGDSGPRASEGGRYTYDDLVTRDLPAIHAFARSRDRKKRRVILVGHSLGGHVGLAAQGTGRVAFDAIVAVAANLWMPQFERSGPRRALRRLLLSAIDATARRVGRFPARALRMGSDDEARAYFEDLGRFARTGRWSSADGAVDYLASLARVTVPVLQLVSDGDRMACRPEGGALFLQRCGGPQQLLQVTRADDGGPAPGHMGLVTSGRIGRAWDGVEAWMRDPTLALGAF
jgi:predicted alpha/beta hydrolase